MKAEKPTSHHSDSTDMERAHARDYERLGRVEHWSQQESEDTEGAKHRHDRRRWKRDFSYRMSPNCKQFGREKLQRLKALAALGVENFHDVCRPICPSLSQGSKTWKWSTALGTRIPDKTRTNDIA